MSRRINLRKLRRNGESLRRWLRKNHRARDKVIVIRCSYSIVMKEIWTWRRIRSVRSTENTGNYLTYEAEGICVNLFLCGVDRLRHWFYFYNLYNNNNVWPIYEYVQCIIAKSLHISWLWDGCFKWRNTAAWRRKWVSSPLLHTGTRHADQKTEDGARQTG